jgi:anti-sigma factor RsiW
MDHNEAVRQKATERFLLGELDPDERDQFEEHLFDCQDCALDVRAGAMFVQQSKILLAGEPAPSPARVPTPVPARSGWFAWFRPAFAVPVLASLLAVMGYQNFVTYPHLMEAANQPQPGPWVSVNVDTRSGPGDAAPTPVKPRAGESLVVVLNLPPKSSANPSPQDYTSYTAELYNPAGKLEWSGTLAMSSAEENRQISVPGRNRPSGIYTLVVRGITASGESKEVTRRPIDVQTQK